MFGQKKYKEINRLLNQRFAEKGALIAVHRGAWGGNIVENTIPSCSLALGMGADMFECDLASSTDGVIYAFHDGTEPRNLKRQENIKTLSSTEIDQMTYQNSIGHDSGFRVERLDDILAHFNNGELFNIDRAWDILPQVIELLNCYPHAKQQAVLKSPVKAEVLSFLDSCPHKYMFMPIVYSMEDIEMVLSYKSVNTVGMELIAYTKDHPLFKDETISYLHNRDLFCWANVIKLGINPEHSLYAGYDDDMALLHSPDQSWGVLFEKGLNVLQTDWPLQLSQYRNEYYSDLTRHGVHNV